MTKIGAADSRTKASRRIHVMWESKGFETNSGKRSNEKYHNLEFMCIPIHLLSRWCSICESSVEKIT